MKVSLLILVHVSEIEPIDFIPVPASEPIDFIFYTWRWAYHPAGQ